MKQNSIDSANNVNFYRFLSNSCIYCLFLCMFVFSQTRPTTITLSDYQKKLSELHSMGFSHYDEYIPEVGHVKQDVLERLNQHKNKLNNTLLSSKKRCETDLDRLIHPNCDD